MNRAFAGRVVRPERARARTHLGSLCYRGRVVGGAVWIAGLPDLGFSREVAVTGAVGQRAGSLTRGVRQLADHDLGIVRRTTGIPLHGTRDTVDDGRVRLVQRARRRKIPVVVAVGELVVQGDDASGPAHDVLRRLDQRTPFDLAGLLAKLGLHRRTEAAVYGAKIRKT